VAYLEWHTEDEQVTCELHRESVLPVERTYDLGEVNGGSHLGFANVECFVWADDDMQEESDMKVKSVFAKLRNQLRHARMAGEQ
jgi:hypothetical protein